MTLIAAQARRFSAVRERRPGLSLDLTLPDDPSGRRSSSSTAPSAADGQSRTHRHHHRRGRRRALASVALLLAAAVVVSAFLLRASQGETGSLSQIAGPMTREPKRKWDEGRPAPRVRAASAAAEVRMRLLRLPHRHGRRALRQLPVQGLQLLAGRRPRERLSVSWMGPIPATQA